MTEVRTVNNYSFLNEKGIMIDITDKRKEKYHLFGQHTGDRARIIGSTYCDTSIVLEVSEFGKVVTENSMYQLGTISTDYQEFLEVSRNGMLYVTNWSLYGSKGMYYIKANMYPKRQFILLARVISQNGNFLTIQRLIKDPIANITWGKPEKIFVCWNVMSDEMVENIKKTGKITEDLEFSNFQEFNGTICRPVLEI